MMNFSVSVVIPVYNSEIYLKDLVRRLNDVLSNLTDTFEVICIDDNSKDSSWKTLQAIQESNRKIKIIRMRKNFGQHNALFCGLSYANGDYIVTMDDDLQQYPEDIPSLLNALIDSDVDVVIASYTIKKHSLLRNLGTKAIDYLMSVMLGKRKDLKLTSFRVLTKEVKDSVLSLNNVSPKINVCILAVTDRIINYQVSHHERSGSKSGYSLLKLSSTFKSYVLENSTIPLKLMSFIGLVSFLLSFALMNVFIVRYLLFGISIMGWLSIIVAVLFLNGIELLCMGVIGEYLLSILVETRKNPSYFIREEKL